jgi:hypothetical protein
MRWKRMVVTVDVRKVRWFNFSCKALQMCLIRNVMENARDCTGQT